MVRRSPSVPCRLDQRICLQDRWRGLPAAIRAGDVPGLAEYAYELWAFDGNGQAYTSDNRSVTFDINFGREEHQFDPEAIAGFFWELRGLLQDSILLASTENGEFQTGIPGLELQNYIFSDLLSLDSLEAMEASVRQQEAELGAA